MLWYQEHESVICLLQLDTLMELEIEPQISDSQDSALQFERQ